MRYINENWSQKDINIMLAILYNSDVDTMAAKLQKTPGAIRSKLSQMHISVFVTTEFPFIFATDKQHNSFYYMYLWHGEMIRGDGFVTPKGAFISMNQELLLIR